MYSAVIIGCGRIGFFHDLNKFIQATNENFLRLK